MKRFRITVGRLLVPALAAAWHPAIVAAQDTEEIQARMEFDRVRLYSGGPVNIAERRQLARLRVEAMVGASPYPASALSRRWRPLGPDRTDAFGHWMSARVSTVAIHPRDPDIVYIGAAQGGVWRTTNAGASWEPLTDGECSLAMGAIAIDPVVPDIVYAGTGEQHFSGVSYYGCGVLRSLDGGDSWERLGADAFSHYWGGAMISRILVDPATAGSRTSTVVLAASTNGLLRSTDSGRSWTEVLSGTATDLVARPGDPARLHAAVHRKGVFQSGDGGASWSEVSPDFGDASIGRINLAVAPSSPDVLYAAVYNDAEGATAEGLLLYRSDDGAESWRRLDATGASCHWQCWYDLTLAVHPNDPDRVNLGTIYMYLSEDGGQTFRTQHPPDIHVDQHFLVYDTLSGSDVLYLANDGGVFRSTDAGISFTSLSTNLAITQFYAGIDLHPADPEVALGGTQDQGTQRSSSGTATWARVLGGDGGHTAFDDEDPEIWYAETQWIAGADYIGPRKNGSLAVTGIERNERGLFIPPLVMDPVDSRRLYFGTRRLYRTDDAAETWTPVFETSRGVITAVAPALSDPLTVYVAVGGWVYAGGGGGGYGTDGLIAVTRDGGSTWSRSSQGLPERYVADLSVHPTDPDRAYAVLGGFLSGHVFATTDGGRTWQDRSGNLPDMPVNAVLHDPADPAGVYVGTDLGVFHSATGGGAWTPLRDGFPSVAVFDLAAQPGTGRLVAATHGRGMFEIPIEIPLLAQVRPWTVTDTVFAGVDTVAVGDVIVAPRGRGDYAAAWDAETSGEPWLTLSDADGVGRGRFEYRIAGVNLVPGDHPATITVATAGTDPVVIPVNVHARQASTIAASRTGHRTAVPVGHAQPIADSLRVTFSGPLADATAWNAVRRGAGWADLIVASGVGDGVVTWSGDASALGVGVHIDTLRVHAVAAGSPVIFVDTLAVEPALAVTALQTADGLGVAGLDAAPGGLFSAGLTGFGADSAMWTATTDAPWQRLERASGGRADSIAWSRSAVGLQPGVYEATVVVGVEGRPELRGLIVDRFHVADPVAVEAAAHHLLGVERLAAGQTDFLDWFGNRDGEFNAGDVLRWLDHCSANETAGGCAAVPAHTAPAGAIAVTTPPAPPRPGRRP